MRFDPYEEVIENRERIKVEFASKGRNCREKRASPAKGRLENFLLNLLTWREIEK